MVEFKGFVFELELEPQMPMIHFQSGQDGATLRASEVKPKLDRYILNRILSEESALFNEEDIKRDVRYQSFFQASVSKDNRALDYKLQIGTYAPTREVYLKRQSDNEIPSYSIYYGNMGRAPQDKIYGVFSYPKVTIVCFKQKLREYLESVIESFFLVTNFGTMQNKGFGSFVPKGFLEKGKQEQQIDIHSGFRKLIPGCRCFALQIKGHPGTSESQNVDALNRFCSSVSDVIKDFYGVMKTGYNVGRRYFRSYIYQYGHEKLKLGNEKAWMKQKGIAPIVCRTGNEKKHEYGSMDEQKQRYLRAFLGVGEGVEYGTGYYDRSGKEVLDKRTPVKVAIKSDEFERISSPIYFKVVYDTVYIVAFPIPDEIYGKKFKFSVSKGKNGVISVPRKDELPNGFFDIQSFLADYVKVFESKRQELGVAKGIQAIKEVK